MLQPTTVFVASLTALVTLSALFSIASAATIQNPSLLLPADAAQNLQTVKGMFLYTYDAYKSVLPTATMAEILTVVTGSTRGVMMIWTQSTKISPTDAMDGVRPSLILFPQW